MRKKEKKSPKKGSAVDIMVFGVVQGVGFRPFIYRLAQKYHYKGWVQNKGFGVKIHLETNKETDFHSFIQEIKDHSPSLSQIEDLTFQPTSFQNLQEFQIKKSQDSESFVFISPDISICDHCYREMINPSDRRFHYPFINCTDCGPRYTIVESLPYDRPQTSMKNFTMCEQCRREYQNPLDRRYHAQPIACPRCGPQVKLIKSKEETDISGGIQEAADLINQGKILAVKGLGGFHLVCSPFLPRTLSRLRKIKQRRTKPLALMARDTDTVRQYAYLSSSEEELLCSPRRPIVLLNKKKDIEGISPFLHELGFMLPYTPLHYLLLQKTALIVATSSNKKDSPIMKDEEGIEKLCDYILTHNRPIHMRADDSVLKVVEKSPLFLRRARGYVPFPQKVPPGLKSSSQIIALGGELKDTVSVYKNGYVVTSQFLGDLDEYPNLRYFEETLHHLTHLFEVKPELVVSDLHPNFHTTRYAQKMGIPHLQVQHHFAHILAPLLEHQIPPGTKVLGVALDGYGYGADGHGWGGEFLIGDYSSYQRFAHFRYVPLPGGDAASKQPWRMALSYLRDSFGPSLPEVNSLEKISPNKRKGILTMMEKKLRSPLISSCGRLFDAVAFLAGVSPDEMEFEAEAPMRLEAAAAENLQDFYPFSVEGEGRPFQISFSQTIQSLVQDLHENRSPSLISAKFHNTLSQVILTIAEKVRKEQNIQTVVLIGGVFLNKRLLHTTQNLLQKKDFHILRPVLYSPNDESISLGQIAHGLNYLT
ncbi:carbamoyltransferase HypF [bacterium]|nr:carbamoyltransferase HypF [bacterium]